MKRIYDMIILGGGPGGYTAALYAARAGLEVLVLEKLSAGGQMALTGSIDNYPGFPEGVDGFTLGMQMQAGAERFGAKTQYAEVLSVALSETPKRIETSDGTQLARAVILCTGADPRKLGLDGEEALTGRGVHYCAHCDGRFYKDKTVVVVGGGNTAAADALYLSHLAKKVILVHRRNTLRATKIYHEPLMRAENLEFCWNSRVSALHADGRLNGVEITDVLSGETQTVSCDAVFVSIGREPLTALFKGQLALDDAGYIVADESTKTSLAGVFAAGDVRQKALRQVITAAADGATAAHFAEEYLAQNQA